MTECVRASECSGVCVFLGSAQTDTAEWLVSRASGGRQRDRGELPETVTSRCQLRCSPTGE